MIRQSQFGICASNMRADDCFPGCGCGTAICSRMVQTHTFAVQAGTSQAARMYTPAIVSHNLDTISRHSISQLPQDQLALMSGECLRTRIPRIRWCHSRNGRSTLQYLTRPGLSAFLHIVCTLADPSACFEAGMSCPILVDDGARVGVGSREPTNNSVFTGCPKSPGLCIHMLIGLQ